MNFPPLPITLRNKMDYPSFHLWALRNGWTFPNCYFMYKLQNFNHQIDTVKNYSSGAFQAFYTRSRSSHSKAFIYLKSLKTVCIEVNLLWSCEMPTRNFMTIWKKALSHILRQVFCLHFLRMHLDTSSEEALEVCEQNFFLKI